MARPGEKVSVAVAIVFIHLLKGVSSQLSPGPASCDSGGSGVSLRGTVNLYWFLLLVGEASS